MGIKASSFASQRSRGLLSPVITDAKSKLTLGYLGRLHEIRCAGCRKLFVIERRDGSTQAFSDGPLSAVVEHVSAARWDQVHEAFERHPKRRRR